MDEYIDRQMGNWMVSQMDKTINIEMRLIDR